MVNPIQAVCPGCHRKLRVAAARAGKRVRCPATGCGTLVDVPLPAETPVDDENPFAGIADTRSPAVRRLDTVLVAAPGPPADADAKPPVLVRLAALSAVVAAVAGAGYMLWTAPRVSSRADYRFPKAGHGIDPTGGMPHEWIGPRPMSAAELEKKWGEVEEDYRSRLHAWERERDGYVNERAKKTGESRQLLEFEYARTHPEPQRRTPWELPEKR